MIYNVQANKKKILQTQISATNVATNKKMRLRVKGWNLHHKFPHVGKNPHRDTT